MNNHAPLLAGVDTGGTYTDAALIDGATQVKATAKALTTPGRLAVGVGEALERALMALEAGRRAASGWWRYRRRWRPMRWWKAMAARSR